MQEAITTVSVVTPALNPGNSLNRLRDNLNKQKDVGIEWIVVNDGSDSDQLHFFDQLKIDAEFPIHVIHVQKNNGQAAARNLGISRANGEFISFIDADDSISPDYFESLVISSRHAENRGILSFAPTSHIYDSRRENWTNNSFRDLDRSTESQIIRFLYRPFLSHCGVLFPSSTFEVCGGYDESLDTDEDGELLIRVLCQGWTFEVTEGIWYEYRHQTQKPSVSDDNTTKKIASRHLACQKIRDHLSSHDWLSNEEVQEALCKRIDAIAVSAWSIDSKTAEEIIEFAETIRPNYKWCGGNLEHFVRRLGGIRLLIFSKKIRKCFQKLRDRFY